MIDAPRVCLGMLNTQMAQVNSGQQGGLLLKRNLFKKRDGSFYGVDDLKVCVNSPHPHRSSCLLYAKNALEANPRAGVDTLGLLGGWSF